MDITPQYNQPINPIPTSRRHFWLTIAVVAIVAVVVFVGIWYWQRQNSDLPIPTFTPRPTQDISNWKTYRNEQYGYGFEFKYPSDWKLLDDGSNVSVYTFQYDGSLKSVVENGAKMEIRIQRLIGIYNIDQAKPVRFGYNNAHELLEDSVMGPGTNRTIYLQDPNSRTFLYISLFFNHELYLQSFNQILSTFRFSK